MRVLHAIHDFLPRHRAGSEIYAFELAREQAKRHDVFIVAADYDPSIAHGTLRWRCYEGLTVIELVNNWEFDRFDETYSSPRLNAQLRHALDATRPDVLHVHNLLNLSLDLPRLARERGVATAATLHDYTFVCVSGGQRVHAAEAHVCETIDAERCSRCFTQSAFYRQMAAGRIARLPGGRTLARAALTIRHLAPSAAWSATRVVDAGPIGAGDIRRRLAYARHAFDSIDLFVAPSRSVAAEFERFGVDPRRIEVSDYGFAETAVAARPTEPRHAVRFGFVGTLVWHKGAHVLLEAAGQLRGSFEVHLHGETSVFPAYVAELRQKAEGLPVTWHGGFDRSRVGDVYRDIDVLVVPSLWPENSPLVIHEAFMHGIPVVGSRMGGIAELVADGVNGSLCDPFSAASLRDSLQRFIDDPWLALRFGACVPAVKSIDEDARQWDARYAQLVGASREVAAVL